MVSLSNGTTVSPTRLASSRCGYPERMNSSIPNRQYSISSSATCLGSPTIAVPQLTRTVEIPFQSRFPTR